MLLSIATSTYGNAAPEDGMVYATCPRNRHGGWPIRASSRRVTKSIEC